MMKHFFRCAAVAALFLAVGTGCQSENPQEDLSAVPSAYDDPANMTALNGGVTPWTDGAANLDSADANGWRVADPSGNRLGMPVIYFAYDSDVLVPSETANLDKIANYMLGKPKLALVIEGHCDQRGTDEYNRALGERRANAIRAYLAQKGIADNRMNTMSFGKDKPAVEGSGDSVWRQNRRGVPVPMIMP